LARGQGSCAPLLFTCGWPRHPGARHQRFGGCYVRRRDPELFRAGKSAAIHYHFIRSAADGHLDQHHHQPFGLPHPRQGHGPSFSHAALSLGQLDRPGLHRRHRLDHGDHAGNVFVGRLCGGFLSLRDDALCAERGSPHAGAAGLTVMRADTPASVRELDEKAPLKDFRARFTLPPGVIYLDGNSLGAMPKVTVPRLDEVVRREWGEGLIRSWNDCDWVGAPRRVGDKIAALIGAREGEVVVADSTSVNLFKLLMAAMSARSERKV